VLSCTNGCCCCCCCVAMADLGGSARASESASGSSALRLPWWLGDISFSLTLRLYIYQVTYQRALWDFRRKRPLRASRTFQGSAAVPRVGMVKAHTAHMPGEWARSRSRSGRQGLSKRKSKVERRKTGRHKPSEIFLVLRFLLFGLLLLFVARCRVLGRYDLANLAHGMLWLWSSKTADVRPSTIPNHRGALAKHLQAPRQQTPPAAPAPGSTRSLAVRANTLRYSDSPLNVGGSADAAAVTGGIVKVEAMYASGLKVEMRRARSALAPAPRTPIHPYPHSRSHSHPRAAGARL
jgi:hypothetical protein